jgi:LacI family transcriptional regulator, galactose operon repressor
MVTMQDIANKAGFSKGTVSYVLSGKHKKAGINQDTCKKIIGIAEELGYRRNAIAQSMTTGKTNIIGFVGFLDGGYVMDIITGVNSTAAKSNYLIKLLPIKTDDDAKHAARQCVEQRLAGVICRSLSEKKLDILHRELEPLNIPIVLVDSSFPHDWCSRVVSDDFTGAKLATEHLLDLGHRRIGHVTNSLTHGFTKTRYNGYLTAMKASGNMMTAESVCEIADPEYMISDLFRQAATGFINNFKPTAIFCGSDIIAMKLLIIASELGLNIPSDISIVGYAGLNLSVIANPPLTTINQRFDEMGKKAAEILISEMKNKSSKKEVKLPVEMIVRNSTAALKQP